MASETSPTDNHKINLLLFCEDDRQEIISLLYQLYLSEIPKTFNHVKKGKNISLLHALSTVKSDYFHNGYVVRYDNKICGFISLSSHLNKRSKISASHITFKAINLLGLIDGTTAAKYLCQLQNLVCQNPLLSGTQIHSFIIAESFRSKKIGSFILSEVEKIASSYDDMVFLYVLDGNKSLNFYVRNGYEIKSNYYKWSSFFSFKYSGFLLWKNTKGIKL